MPKPSKVALDVQRRILRVTITHDYFETFGSNTLSGQIFRIANPDEYDIIILDFVQTTIEWRRNNGGPATIVMPEYVPMCFIEDVLDLSKRKKVLVEHTLVSKLGE